MTMASSPAARRSRSHASMLARAKPSAGASWPRWWASAPQQPLPRRDHDLAAMPGQQPDRRLVDLGRQHLLRAARQQRDPHAPLAFGREDLRPIRRRGGGDRAGRQREQWREPRGQKPREGLGDSRAAQGEPEQERPRQDRAEQPPQQPLAPRPAVIPFDPAPRVVDEVHVIDAGRAGRHAGQAGEAAVDVLDRIGGDRAAARQHVLDQVDAAARAVELVAEQDIGRAGRGAEAAMRAGPQDLLGCRGVGIGELLRGEVGLHRLNSLRPCGRG